MKPALATINEACLHDEKKNAAPTDTLWLCITTRITGDTDKAKRALSWHILFPAKLSRKGYDSFPAKGQQTNCDRPAFADT